MPARDINPPSMMPFIFDERTRASPDEEIGAAAGRPKVGGSDPRLRMASRECDSDRLGSRPSLTSPSCISRATHNRKFNLPYCDPIRAEIPKRLAPFQRANVAFADVFFRGFALAGLRRGSFGGSRVERASRGRTATRKYSFGVNTRPAPV